VHQARVVLPDLLSSRVVFVVGLVVVVREGCVRRHDGFEIVLVLEADVFLDESDPGQETALCFVAHQIPFPIRG
jgi:hypothetical protein